MARVPHENAGRIYAAADQFVARCLRTDDSLFTPGKAIWSARVAQEVKTRFVDNVDDSPDTFMEKLTRQFDGASPEAIQLIAEMLYVYCLPAQSIGGVKKREIILEVLGWSPHPVDIPADLAATLDLGLYHPGMSFQSHRFWFLVQIIAFIQDWKALPAVERDRLLSDAPGFKTLLFRNEVERAAGQRHALLHLVHPDAFEPIVSPAHKRRIVAAFAEYVEDQDADLDVQLQQIREALDAEHGQWLSFYREPLLQRWEKQAPPPPPTGEPDEIVNSLLPDPALRAKFLETMARAIEQANARNPASWSVTLGKRVVRLNVGPLRALDVQRDQFSGAVVAAQEDPLFDGLKNVTLGEKSFDSVPEARDVHIKKPAFNAVWDQIAERHRALIASAARMNGRYTRSHSRPFIEYLAGAVGRTLPLGPGGNGGGSGEPPGSSLSAVEDELFLESGTLERIAKLLEDKRQVIFHGPPGTGKTYIARRFAAHLAGTSGCVELVQFHPSYAYEDFVEGFRPAEVKGRPGFSLVPGPLKRLAQGAAARPDATFVLIIDELNRGNVAKVFGELYFLLEYRDQQVSLQYSREPFALPNNLVIIGTMNTADRSIAMVDLALRRRFHFAPFFPDRAPIKGVLRRWLARHAADMDWVADVVDHANALIEDRHVAIGPSHFMRPELDEDWMDLIWEHSVLPYLEEQFFGQDERIRAFQLDRLRREVQRLSGAGGVREEGGGDGGRPADEPR